MRFAVESWDPAYGIAAAESALEPANQPVDLAIERSPDAWTPITPDSSQAAVSVLFVDGVRRIDSRVWIDDGAISRPAVCATVAAGAVRCEAGAATIVAVEIERGLYTAVAGAESIVTAHGTYEVKRATGDDDAALYLSVHTNMTDLETSMSVDLDDADLVVFDGPLRGRVIASGVGYVKTQHVQYLEPEQSKVLTALDDGQRTPLFAIGGRFPRWSWYLRLPGPRSHALSGIVRLELPGMGEAEDAVSRAEVVSSTLPRFASEPYKDARAPQNLHPIAGLERHLSHRLGDPYLLERGLRLASSPTPV